MLIYRPHVAYTSQYKAILCKHVIIFLSFYYMQVCRQHANVNMINACYAVEGRGRDKNGTISSNRFYINQATLTGVFVSVPLLGSYVSRMLSVWAVAMC